MNLYESEIYKNDIRRILPRIVHKEKLYGASILITGASGTVGSFMVDTIRMMNDEENARIKVFVAGRNIRVLEGKWREDENITCIFYDLLKPIEFDLNVDYIVHAAGNADPGTFNVDPVGTIVGNVEGTHRLLDYGREHGCKRLLFVSSGEVYGQGDRYLDSFVETYAGYLDSTSPRSCYPNSKRVAETLCCSYAKQYGLETVIVRLCHTYGPGITDYDTRANAQFLRNGLKHQDIVLMSAGTQMRSYNYIADCISAILTVLIEGAAVEAYNIANMNSRVTIAEFAQAVALASGSKVIFETSSKLDYMNQTPIVKQILNTDKLEALGWSGVFNLNEGIQHTLDILKEIRV